MNPIYTIMLHVVYNNYGMKSLIPFPVSGVSNSASRIVSGGEEKSCVTSWFLFKTLLEERDSLFYF